MSQEQKIISILENIAAARQLRVSPEKLREIAKSLQQLSLPTREKVRNTVRGMDYILKEAIDLSSVDYWLDQIVDVLQNR